jgi:hypothetical protein
MSALADELVRQAKQDAADGRIDEAKTAYLRALQHEPDHADAMTGLGALLASIGMATDARVILEETVRRHPAHADAHRVLVTVCSALGDKAAAYQHSMREFEVRPILTIPYAGSGTPVRLLLVSAADGINTRTARFRDRRLFETTYVAAEFIGDRPLPDHDIVFNTIGDAERSLAVIDAAERVVARTTRPVLNHPRHIRATQRVDNARRLAAIPGVRTARMARIPRARAADPTLIAELGLPFLLRVPGHHTGEFFERIDDPAQIETALAALPGDELLAMSFLDTRDEQGRYHKYRMMIIDGTLYPLHAAMGTTWKLHFFSGTHGADERALDTAFLADPEAGIGTPAMTALRAIAAELHLDYGGIDFGIDRDGNVLVFEANATMTVPEADPDPAFAYRTPYLDTVAVAVMRMFVTRAKSAAARTDRGATQFI